MKHLLRSTMLAAAVLLPAAAIAATPEAVPVQALNAALIASMKAGSAGESFQSRAAALAPVVNASYDMAEVEKNSVGFLWSTIPAAQQERVAAAFEKFTVASYVSEFSKYNGETITLLPTEKALGADKIVETEIVPADGSAPTRLDYVVANGPAGWQITDVLLNGTISQVAIHSSDFSSLVTSGNATQLIAALEKKTATLASGAGS
ncbi:MAG TPA: ABC transporter substrate-binding protein [Acidocella sp.]|uniref:ABC transporter substrate-binding protein n=1 Tax=Acidocella sp. TaxID=50710 RepID=UPI002CEEB4DF|nr:ABC transporter substrate-binding protein [Acidocella sp.]HVE20848.1 ABC transporter substrate-binding protein [Acidocella sp.]